MPGPITPGSLPVTLDVTLPNIGSYTTAQYATVTGTYSLGSVVGAIDTSVTAQYCADGTLSCSPLLPAGPETISLDYNLVNNEQPVFSSGQTASLGFPFGEVVITPQYVNLGTITPGNPQTGTLGAAFLLATPEPASIGLAGIGLALGIWRMRKKRA